MRLIDADELKAVIIKEYREVFFGSVLWNILNDIPTAYDIDKVIEEITKLRNDAYSYAFKYNDEFMDGESKGLEDALNIIDKHLGQLKEQNK